MKLFDIDIRLHRTHDPERTRGAGCSEAYDVFAVKGGAEILIGSCFRLGVGPDSWHGRSAFGPHEFEAAASRQECLEALVRAYRNKAPGGGKAKPASGLGRGGSRVPPRPLLEVETEGDWKVVRFAPGFLDAQGVESVWPGLTRLAGASGCCKLHLDFGNVESVTAAVLGKIVVLHRKLRAAGGELVVGNVGDRLYEVFAATRLTKLLDIRPVSGKSVLVVDDDPATREAMRTLLEEEGYRVACAGDGREALDRLRGEVPPSLILLDLMMGGMDGWQFRREQKQDPALAAIPVVVVSGAGDVSSRAASLGAASYVQKPVEFGHLLATVRQVC